MISYNIDLCADMHRLTRLEPWFTCLLHSMTLPKYTKAEVEMVHMSLHTGRSSMRISRSLSGSIHHPNSLTLQLQLDHSLPLFFRQVSRAAYAYRHEPTYRVTVSIDLGHGHEYADDIPALGACEASP
jgi:hypothetical protein